MKKLQQLITGVFLLMIISGCPYESKVALSDPGSAEIDAQYLGEWFSTDTSESVNSYKIRISQFNSGEYVINYQEFKSDSLVNTELWRGFITRVNNKDIFNLNAIGTEITYFFYLFELEGNRLSVSGASDNYIKTTFNSEVKLYDYFKNNMNNPGFFEDPTVFVRKK